MLLVGMNVRSHSQRAAVLVTQPLREGWDVNARGITHRRERVAKVVDSLVRVSQPLACVPQGLMRLLQREHLSDAGPAIAHSGNQMTQGTDHRYPARFAILRPGFILAEYQDHAGIF